MSFEQAKVTRTPKDALGDKFQHQRASCTKTDPIITRSRIQAIRQPLTWHYSVDCSSSLPLAILALPCAMHLAGRHALTHVDLPQCSTSMCLAPPFEMANEPVATNRAPHSGAGWWLIADRRRVSLRVPLPPPGSKTQSPPNGNRISKLITAVYEVNRHRQDVLRCKNVPCSLCGCSMWSHYEYRGLRVSGSVVIRLSASGRSPRRSVFCRRSSVYSFSVSRFLFIWSLSLSLQIR